MATLEEALAAVDNCEQVEVWDGEVVVKGQPARRHERLRALLTGELASQLPPRISLYASSPLEADDSAPRSDLSAINDQTNRVVLWVEVLSASDLATTDARLVGRRRIDWLLAHGVDVVWVFVDLLDELELMVITSAGAEHHWAPQAPTLTLYDEGEELNVSIDLGRLATVLAQSPESW